MYLRGSKWSMNRRRRRSNPFTIIVLVALIGVFFYIDRVIVPDTQPLFVPTATPTRSPESFVADAEAFYTEGKLRQAISSYEQAIQSDPTNAATFIAIARLQVFVGDYESALSNAGNALLLNSENAMAYAVRGWALALSDNPDYTAANEAVDKALELDPNSALAHAYKAEILALEYENGDEPTLDAAIEESRTARDLDSTLFEVHRVRGYIYTLTQEFDLAIEEYQAAIDINPNIPDLHNSLGYVYLVQTEPDYESAISEFERAYSLNPDDPYPNYMSSRAYLRWGEFAKALQYAESAVETDPGNSLYLANLGSIQYKNGDYADAVDSLRLAIRGGTTEAGVVVEGIPLSDDYRTIEFYSRYGLALANNNECGEALQISQAMLDTLRNDETAIFNAQQMVTVCEENLNGTATPEPTSETDSGTEGTTTP